MMPLRAALFAEGKSDRGLIRVLEQLCARELGSPVRVEWSNDLLYHFNLGHAIAPRVSKLLELDAGYDLLFVHRDADADEPSQRRSEISLAFKHQPILRPHVPVVPIQELEAWLLVDERAILAATGNSTTMSLGLPKLKHIEGRARPKELLREVLAQANVRSRGKQPKSLTDKEFGRLRARLLERLDIDGPVTQLSAWQQLLRDLEQPLSHLRLQQLAKSL